MFGVCVIVPHTGTTHSDGLFDGRSHEATTGQGDIVAISSYFHSLYKSGVTIECLHVAVVSQRCYIRILGKRRGCSTKDC